MSVGLPYSDLFLHICSIVLRAYELPGDNPSRKYFATVKVDDVSGSTQDSTEAAGWDKRFSL